MFFYPGFRCSVYPKPKSRNQYELAVTVVTKSKALIEATKAEHELIKETEKDLTELRGLKAEKTHEAKAARVDHLLRK